MHVYDLSRTDCKHLLMYGHGVHVGAQKKTTSIIFLIRSIFDNIYFIKKLLKKRKWEKNYLK